MVRLKHRYIICQQILDSPNSSVNLISSRDIIQAIREKIQILFGDIGSGEIGHNSIIKYYDDIVTRIFVIRIPREAEQSLWFTLSCITQIKNISMIIRVLDCCSCVRTLQNSLIKIFEKVQNFINNENEKLQFNDLIIAANNIDA